MNRAVIGIHWLTRAFTGLLLASVYLFSAAGQTGFSVAGNTDTPFTYCVAANMAPVAMQQGDPAKTGSQGPSFSISFRERIDALSVNLEQFILQKVSASLQSSDSILRHFRKLSPVFPFHYFW